jgi:SPX domain protein involved in polyphosphate accumulation
MVSEPSNKSNTEVFNRKTYKFLVNNADVQTLIDILERDCVQIKYPNNMTNTQSISSLYFDDSHNTCYTSRLKKEANNDLFRLRVYNRNTNSIYAEIKSNNSLCYPKNPTKERLMFHKEDIHKLLHCSLHDMNHSSHILDRINYMIHTQNIKPKVIIEYTRASFEKNGFKITLDYHINGQKVSNDDILSNLLIDEKNANSSGVFRMNYAIMEIKTESNSDVENMFLTRALMKKNLIKPLNCFSKFLTVYFFYFSNTLSMRPFWFNSLVGDAYCNNSKNLFPIALKPNTFTSLEALFYRIFNIIIGIPLTLMKYEEITNHKSILLKPEVLKHYLVLCLVLNLMTFLKVKNNMLNRTINHIGTGFPFLMTFVFMLSLIF